MPGISEYIEQFGAISFSERPFTSADNLTFCELSYLDIEHVVSPSFDDEPLPLSKVCNDLFALHGYEHKPLGLVLPSNPSEDSMRMAIQKRFSEVKIWAVQTAYERSPALQFAAMTFLLPTGDAVVTFRGTDDTLAGWIEDLNLFLQDSIPSRALSSAYLKEVASRTDGGIYLCGHSKGGHLALYSAVKADEALRARIKGVYNNEGPGFLNYDLFKTAAYRELLPRYHHYVPYASFIGMMLAHDYDYSAVFSTKHLGPFQHDMASWQIVNGAVITRPDVNELAKITDIVFSEFPHSVSEKQRRILAETADKLSSATKEELLTGIVKHFPREVFSTYHNWFTFPKEKRREFHAAFKAFPDIVKHAVKNIKEDSIPAAARSAGVLLRKVTARV